MSTFSPPPYEDELPPSPERSDTGGRRRAGLAALATLALLAVAAWVLLRPAEDPVEQAAVPTPVRTGASPGAPSETGTPTPSDAATGEARNPFVALADVQEPAPTTEVPAPEASQTASQTASPAPTGDPATGEPSGGTSGELAPGDDEPTPTSSPTSSPSATSEPGSSSSPTGSPTGGKDGPSAPEVTGTFTALALRNGDEQPWPDTCADLRRALRVRVLDESGAVRAAAELGRGTVVQQVVKDHTLTLKCEFPYAAGVPDASVLTFLARTTDADGPTKEQRVPRERLLELGRAPHLYLTF